MTKEKEKLKQEVLAVNHFQYPCNSGRFNRKRLTSLAFATSTDKVLTYGSPGQNKLSLLCPVRTRIAYVDRLWLFRKKNPTTEPEIRTLCVLISDRTHIKNIAFVRLSTQESTRRPIALLLLTLSPSKRHVATGCRLF